MKKKLILSLFAISIFLMPVQNGIFPNEANAIWGKVANMTAKKAAKEVIKDIAIETSLNLAVSEAQKIADAASWNLNVQEEFTAICLESLEPSGECKKPVQIKKTLTETDKQNIGTNSEIELEKLLNNGVKYSKWQKFLDFFLPIFSTTLILTGITYAIDPEVKSLFDEVAINTLIALGLMKPIAPIEEGIPQIVDKTSGEVIPEGGTTTGGTSASYTLETTNTTGVATMTFPNTNQKNLIVLTQFDHSMDVPTFVRLQYSEPTYGYFALNPDSSITTPTAMYKTSYFSMTESKLYRGETLLGTTPNDSISKALIPYADYSKLNAIMTRSLYQKSDGFWYSEHLMFTTDGKIYKNEMKVDPSTNMNNTYTMNKVTTTVFGKEATTGNNNRPIGMTTATKQTVYTNAVPQNFEPYNPLFEDMTVPTTPSKYEKDGEVILVPPIAIPYTHSDTGETLSPQYDPTTGTTEIVDKDGNIVPEDKVQVGDPVITNDPEGKPQVQPPPTTQNPSPEPIPLTPTTPTTPTPPTETETPVFPEGEGCEVGLKIPKIKPLTNAVTTAFPFSIPYDLYKGFQALFSEIGTEKPVFNYKVNFMGEQQEWKIAIPDYFDSWKLFTDSLLIFVFDVGLIYAIYRFMSGGGS